jgi:hypothetical protein
MESVVDAVTGLCQPCWRVVVLTPWAVFDGLPRKIEVEPKTRDLGATRDPAGHG